MVGFKFGLKVVLLSFWACRFLCFIMGGHPQAIIVIVPCSIS